VAPGAAITSATPTLTVKFGAATPSQSLALPAGTYEIKAYALAVCTGAVCAQIDVAPDTGFDSGPKGVSLPAANGSNVFQLAAIDVTGAQESQYGSLISVVLLDNNGDSIQLFNGQN